jgi:hypothetical protein
MTERWSYPVAQAMQRHTGCRYVKPKISPPTVPEEAPAPEQAASREMPTKIDVVSDR